MALTIYRQGTLKDIWKLWLGAKLHCTVLPMCLDSVYINPPLAGRPASKISYSCHIPLLHPHPPH
jgi:hypothetical protein